MNERKYIAARFLGAYIRYRGFEEVISDSLIKDCADLADRLIEECDLRDKPASSNSDMDWVDNAE